MVIRLTKKNYEHYLTKNGFLLMHKDGKNFMFDHKKRLSLVYDDISSTDTALYWSESLKELNDLFK